MWHNLPILIIIWLFVCQSAHSRSAPIATNAKLNLKSVNIKNSDGIKATRECLPIATDGPNRLMVEVVGDASETKPYDGAKVEVMLDDVDYYGTVANNKALIELPAYQDNPASHHVMSVVAYPRDLDGYVWLGLSQELCGVHD